MGHQFLKPASRLPTNLFVRSLVLWCRCDDTAGCLTRRICVFLEGSRRLIPCQQSQKWPDGFSKRTVGFHDPGLHDWKAIVLLCAESRHPQVTRTKKNCLGPAGFFLARGKVKLGDRPGPCSLVTVSVIPCFLFFWGGGLAVQAELAGYGAGGFCRGESGFV